MEFTFLSPPAHPFPTLVREGPVTCFCAVDVCDVKWNPVGSSGRQGCPKRSRGSKGAFGGCLEYLKESRVMSKDSTGSTVTIGGSSDYL